MSFIRCSCTCGFNRRFCVGWFRKSQYSPGNPNLHLCLAKIHQTRYLSRCGSYTGVMISLDKLPDWSFMPDAQPPMHISAGNELDSPLGSQCSSKTLGLGATLLCPDWKGSKTRHTRSKGSIQTYVIGLIFKKAVHMWLLSILSLHLQLIFCAFGDLANGKSLWPNVSFA